MEIVDWASIFSMFNILLLLGLLVTYIRNYLVIRSKFGLGLILFAVLFLIHNSLALYFQVHPNHYYANGVEKVALTLNMLEALGLSTLLYITRRPCM